MISYGWKLTLRGEKLWMKTVIRVNLISVILILALIFALAEVRKSNLSKNKRLAVRVIATILIVCLAAYVLFIDAIVLGIIGPVPNWQAFYQGNRPTFESSLNQRNRNPKKAVWKAYFGERKKNGVLPIYKIEKIFSFFSWQTEMFCYNNSCACSSGHK